MPLGLQQYFQAVKPLAQCDAQDGRVVGYLLTDLVGNPTKKDLPHEIRQFANRTAMLRESGCRWMGDMLVAMLAANAQNDSEHLPSTSAKIAATDRASVTQEQATAIGRMLAATRSAHMPASALRQVVHLNAALRTMTSEYTWFGPMLEVLLVPPEGAESPRRSLMTRHSAIVTPQAVAHDVSNANFDSLVRSILETSHHRPLMPRVRALKLSMCVCRRWHRPVQALFRTTSRCRRPPS